jgi:hypothetical protein
MLAKDKHSSLLRKSVNYGRNSTGPRSRNGQEQEIKMELVLSPPECLTKNFFRKINQDQYLLNFPRNSYNNSLKYGACTIKTFYSRNLRIFVIS